RKNMDQKITKALRLSLDERSDIAAAGQSDPLTRLREIYNRQAEKQGNRSHNFKIEKCFGAHSSDFFQVAATGNADHERRKNQRCNNRLDEVEEDVAEEVDIVAPFIPPSPPQVSNQSAKHQANQNLRGQ